MEARSVSVKKRYLNENTSVLFMKAISSKPSLSADTVDFLLNSFNSKVKTVTDEIASMKVRKKSGRQKAPWRNSAAVQNMKRQCGKAEHMWRKTQHGNHHLMWN